MRLSSRGSKAQEAAVFAFSPKHLKVVNKGEGFALVGGVQESTGFNLNPLVAGEMGILEARERLMEEKVNTRILEQIKGVQEEAYREAFALGREEGRKEAFEASRKEIAERLIDIEKLLESLRNIKSELISQGESHLVRLCYFVAKEIAMAQLSEDPTIVAEVIKRVVEMVQTDEEIVVRISPSDAGIIDEIKARLDQPLADIEKVKIVAAAQIQRGGCLVETNYGTVDATIEQRVQKCWENLADQRPKIKDHFNG